MHIWSAQQYIIHYCYFFYIFSFWISLLFRALLFCQIFFGVYSLHIIKCYITIFRSESWMNLKECIDITYLITLEIFVYNSLRKFIILVIFSLKYFRCFRQRANVLNLFILATKRGPLHPFYFYKTTATNLI